MYDWCYNPKKSKDDWCYFDYLSNAIISSGYQIKTTLENLMIMISLHYECYMEDRDECVDSMEAHIDSIEEWVADTLLYVGECGGFREFDYWS